MPHFSTITTINASVAQVLIEAGVSKLQSLGLASNVAVVDAQGYLLAFKRMESAQLPSIEHSINKAYTSALFKLPTAALTTEAEPGGSLYGLNITLDQRVIVFPGGEPLEYEGNIVGAVGVSGGTAEQDQTVASHIVSVFKNLV